MFEAKHVLEVSALVSCLSHAVTLRFQPPGRWFSQGLKLEVLFELVGDVMLGGGGRGVTDEEGNLPNMHRQDT